MSDPTRCCEQVSDGGRWPRFHQCSRRAIIDRGGKLYCKQHDPVEVRRRSDEAYERFKQKMARSPDRMLAAEVKRLRGIIKSVIEQLRKGSTPDADRLAEALGDDSHE